MTGTVRSETPAMEFLPVPDSDFYHSIVLQHLGVDIANLSVELAKVRSKVALVLQAYERLRIETWVRQSDDIVTLPAEECEALARFLAAVEELR